MENEPTSKRTYIEPILTDQERLDISVVEQKISIAQNTLNNLSIPEETKNDQMIALYQASLNIFAENIAFRKFWYETIVKKYNLPNNISIELSTGKMFIEELNTLD